MIRRLWRQMRSTAQIDPVQHSLIVSQDRVASFGYALAGCAYMLRRQKNTRIQAAATVIVIATGLWLRLEADEWALLILAITSVWIAEFVNAAIEAAVNLQGTDYHPMAQVAKDVAAGAVLISAIGALLIGILVLLPPLLAVLQISGASS